MHGLHLIADLHACRCAAGFLLDVAGLESFCVDACLRHGLTVVGRCFHQFLDEFGHQAGVTGTVVLAESHLAVHTWPELSAVTLDLYVCNFSADNSVRAHALFNESIAAFAPEQLEKKEVTRGHLLTPVV
jgi:spermidine synthase/S-adenosylmethionine decarboxylase